MDNEEFIEVEGNKEVEINKISNNSLVRKGYEDLQKRQKAFIEKQNLHKEKKERYAHEKSIFDDEKKKFSQQFVNDLDVDSIELDKEEDILEKEIKDFDDVVNQHNTKLQLIEVSKELIMNTEKVLLKKMHSILEKQKVIEEAKNSRDEKWVSLEESKDLLASDKAMFKVTCSNIEQELAKKKETYEGLKAVRYNFINSIHDI